MRIMVPKPVHGWRGFAGEVGIIVLGVLIALGAQQLAERYSDRERANNAVAAVRREVADHDFTASEIEIVVPCIRAQLDVLQKKLVAGDAAPVPIYFEPEFSRSYVVRVPDRVWSDASWRGLNDTDILRRIEPAFTDNMALYYAQIDAQRQINIGAVVDQVQLNSLAVLMPRGEVSRLAYIDAIQRLSAGVGSLDLVAGQLRDSLAAAGMLLDDRKRNSDLATSGTIKFCRAHGYPLGKLRPADPANV